MVEFGAKLSLKDNMSATLQKNLKMQKQFSNEVNKTSNNIKKLGRTNAKPTLSLKDKASNAIKKVKDGLKAIGSKATTALVKVKDMATKGLSKISGVLGKLAKGVTIGLGVAGAGAVASLLQGADLQQSIGGVETLFKGDASTVKANADMAFKTAGLSANAYMEQVTSFSASLLQSVGGDTAKSAQIADMAIIDMADNANKMGTSMDLIQNAYQGFAKQNYTMLDNLKLGYGGTKEEMQRLLADASKLSGVKYDMSNLSDVYSAIHVIQDNLGITGTTAKEASETFSGSFASMKASAQNLLGNLAIGGDVTGSMEQLVESASTFLFKNAIPMLGNIFKALPSAIKTAIKTSAPQLKGVGGDIVKGIKDGLMALLPSSMSGVIGSAFDGLGNIMGGVKQVMSSVMPVISSLGNMFASIFPNIVSVVSSVVATLVPIIQRIMGVIQRMMPIVTTVIQAIVKVFSTAWSIISPILNIAMSLIEALMGVVEIVFPTMQSVISTVWEYLEPVFGAIADGLSVVGDALSGVADFIGGGVDAIKGWFGFAYGKDRVPYDNYPAILHAGERVLTRNQADQYDRAMSTRGVKVSATSIAPVSSGTNSSGTVVNIEKLADTVVIEKEADVDKVVEGMITKFKKLVPNMP